MPTAFRQFLAVAGGIVAALVVVTVGDGLAGAIAPLPPGLDFKDTQAVAAAIAALPLTAKLVLLAGWAVAAGLGAFTAARTAPTKRVAMGWIAAGFVLVSTVANMLMLPHPAWMWPAAIAAILAAGAFGARAGAAGGEPTFSADPA